jgi:hypothetical protein
MYKISNALVFDDKIDLLLQKEELGLSDITEYKCLKTIHDFFLNNSIPFSVINQIGDSAMDAIEKIKNTPKPDLVVLDLDLNSDGEVDNTDISLLALIIKELNLAFGEFIILIYSSQSESWHQIKQEILDIEPSLNELLTLENVIVFEKLVESNITFNENLSSEIINKKKRYFDRQVIVANKLLSGAWNREIGFILFFFLTLTTLIQLTSDKNNRVLFYLAIIIMLLVAITFVSFNNNIHKDENENS